MRLIDADALLKAVKELQNQRNGINANSGAIIKLIFNAPTVEREWRGLSDEDIEKLNDVFGYFKYGDAQGAKSVEFYKAIEAKLKELNHDRE